MNSFFPDSVKFWNNIGNDFHSCASIGIFKKRIINLIRPSPKLIYSVHDPKGLKYRFQLRIGLSPLKSHKKRHKFVDTPVDWCDCNCAPEDTNHFLFNCYFYEVQRRKLINSVIPLLLGNHSINIVNNTDLLLYGHQSLNFQANKHIILSTISFIKETGKFSS